ncbi:MAG TPA: glycosyltransferase family 2 protein [Vicinamibacteria bacterium]|nr:glycosyltransferase family 2 protein [Vicinamibacteria bacterium]
MPPSISVVFPMWNEEAYIRRAVSAAQDILRGLTDDHEIVIVDDASTDGTGAIAAELSRADPRVRVLTNERNLKLGGTLRRGFQAATKELVLYTDADLPFDLQELPRAVRLLEYQQADLLSAYRFDRTLEGPLRSVYTFFYTRLVRLLFGLRVKDVNFAFKLFRRSLLERFPLRSEGSFIDAELLIRARRSGARIIQIGVDYFPRSRGQSTLSSPGVIVKILREMLGLWPELR